MGSIKINIVEKLYDWFYRKTEVDSLLSGKSDTTHTHTKSQITDLSNASTSSDGLMSSTDKNKLNGIETGANKTTYSSDYSGVNSSSTIAFNEEGASNMYSELYNFINSVKNSISNLDIVNVVSTLPDSGKDNCLYLVPSSSTSVEPNKYDVYVWVSGDSSFEQIDSFTVDLSNYYNKSETYNKTEIDSKISASGTFDSSQYYTKTDIDGKGYVTDISGKADKTEALSGTITFNAKGTTDEGCLVFYTIE